jgi:hypothetical protein
MDIGGYIRTVLEQGTLDLEIYRIRQLMIGAEQHRHSDRRHHAHTVSMLTAIFKALLSAKETRQKVVQQVREDNRGCTENGSASPADDASGGVRVWNVLKQKVPGR